MLIKKIEEICLCAQICVPCQCIYISQAGRGERGKQLERVGRLLNTRALLQSHGNDQLQQANYSMSLHIVPNKSTCTYIERHCFHVEPGHPTPLYRLCVSTTLIT